ncbi:NACHT domain-containing NTPase [Leifsonia sp. YAF41]|uniref:NACHT domain-containing protein n=1 Tax=Leifsonia sp. YAF41 TaxID=3233086 RepID=UPI003F9A518A
MPYLFESLGAESFQKFSQALLIGDFPDLQCFPVGQPDGGRDALGDSLSEDGEFVAVQVKFRRDDEPENAKWMIAALEGELPKIKKLIEGGAKQYIMVTNARGTAHPGGGRIDLVSAWLAEHVAIPAMCMWRDDLEGRLDRADSNLKLSYPSLLSGNDTLVLISMALIGQRSERIGRTLRAFVSEQFRKDEQVKFRQTELANSLLGLFVDVPLDVQDIYFNMNRSSSDHDAVRGAVGRHVNLAKSRRRGTFDTHSDFAFIHTQVTAGAADLLLDRDIQRLVPWIVLQGAPGQGKSTLAQYVCQVHRARYLGKSDFLAKISEPHAAAAFRLPFKVDLRDFAGYIDGRGFLSIPAEETPSPRTLERFVSQLVQLQSGGLDFSADDLAETAVALPVLLFLDGLDEVADLDLREKLVEQINEGLNRLRELGSDIQVVVTSRPSLFGKRPLLSNKRFRKFDLAPIEEETIREYAAKWVVARRLEETDAEEVVEILEQKLDLPHIRELTRNPMQLTILLTLIHSQGHSLPDMRTDLYRQYMDTFMARESEKDQRVREHRLLLLEIVEFLAWTLQSGAEADGSAGSITREDLRQLVADYLSAGSHNPGILEDLFSGGLERVYVLVQRVEGLYEFEVQPLREYFAARYLYASAPQWTSRHRVASGDRAQRFEAIAISPYWANVTRFYAGFYDGGGLGALVYSLQALIGSKDVAASLNARSVGASLLTDWIFRAKKRPQADLVRTVFDHLGVHLAANGQLPGFELGTLDLECGRDELADIIFTEHIIGDENVPSNVMCALLRRNGGEVLATRFVEWCGKATGEERTRRLSIAWRSGAGSGVSSEDAAQLVLGDTSDELHHRNRISDLINHSPATLESSETLGTTAKRIILEWGGAVSNHPVTELSLLSTLLSADTYAGARMHEKLIRPIDIGHEAPSGDVIEKLLAIRETLERPHSRLGIAAWYQILSVVRDEFDLTWGTYKLMLDAIASFSPKARDAGIKKGEIEGFDPIFLAGLQARTRVSISWWRSHLATGDERQQLFWLAMALTWASSSQLISLRDEIVSRADGLNNLDYARLLLAVRYSRHIRRFAGVRDRSAVALPESTTVRVSGLMLAVIGPNERESIPGSALGDAEIGNYLAHADAMKRTEGFEGWRGLNTRQSNKWLEIFSAAHLLRAPIDGVSLRHLYPRNPMGNVPAGKVLAAPEHYQGHLLEAAVSTFQSTYRVTAVRDVAVAESWTFE